MLAETQREIGTRLLLSERLVVVEEGNRKWIHGTILVPCCYYNKLPQTGWFQTTEMYSLMVLGARSSNQAISRAVACPEALWENPVCLFQLLLVPDILGDH